MLNPPSQQQLDKVPSLYETENIPRGYFSLSELQSVKLGGWLEVQNDPTWIIRPVKDIGLIRETLNFKSAIHSQLANKTG